MINNIFNAKRVEIFVNFVTRGVNNLLPNVDAAVEEANRLLKCNSIDEYVRVSRNGSRYPLNRANRYSIFNAWENAANHADYAVNFK